MTDRVAQLRRARTKGSTFTVGEALRRKRLATTNLSARALSLQAGLSESYQGKIENGLMDPSLRAFAKVAVTLGLNNQEIAMIIHQEAERDC